MVAESSEGPFKSDIVVLNVVVLHELLVLFIDRVVCQMHVLVRLARLRAVRFRGEARETFLVDVDAQGLVTRYHHVNTQVELVAVDQQRVADVPRDHRHLVVVQVVQVVDNVDATPSRGVGRLDDPRVSLGLSLLELDEVRVELIELARQHISVRDEVVLFAAELFLRLHKVEAEAVLPRDLVAHGEVVYSLELVEALIEERLARAGGPEHVPLVRVSVSEVVRLEQTAHQLGVAIKQFVKHLEVVDVVGPVLLLLGRHIVQQLVALDCIDHLQLIDRGGRSLPGVVADVAVSVDFLFLVKVLGRSALRVVAPRHQQRMLLFYVAQSFENLEEKLVSFVLHLQLGKGLEFALCIGEVARSRSTCIVCINSTPLLLKLTLNQLQAI